MPEKDKIVVYNRTELRVPKQRASDKVTEGFRRYATLIISIAVKSTSYQPAPPLPLANLRLEAEIRMRSVHFLPKFIQNGNSECFRAVQGRATRFELTSWLGSLRSSRGDRLG